MCIKRKILFLDDGHGQSTPGKRTPIMRSGKAKGRAIRENEFNRAAVQMVKLLAEAEGFEVIEVAQGDEDIALRERSNLANNHYVRKGLGRDEAVFVSIHANAYDGKFATNNGGVETYHFPSSVEGERLARCVHNELIKGTKQIDRGVKSANFHVLRETMMPAILVEALFMDVEEEALLMLDESFQNEVAREVVSGITNYFHQGTCLQAPTDKERLIALLEEALSIAREVK